MQKFDDIYDKEITKRYGKHKMQCLSKRKDRKRDISAGIPFKLDVKDRSLILWCIIGFT